MRIIDVHIHVGHRHEWTALARKVWMDTGPYVSGIFDKDGNQLPQEYGDVDKERGRLGWRSDPRILPRNGRRHALRASGRD